jgi:hypothetical protein
LHAAGLSTVAINIPVPRCRLPLDRTYTGSSRERFLVHQLRRATEAVQHRLLRMSRVSWNFGGGPLIIRRR